MNPESFFENFELLAESPNGIQKLREMILQMAVQGKLVPQNPDDESAEVLLEKIKAEKEKLVKEGKIRKPKNLPPIEENVLPFKLPDRWQWIRFEDISLWANGCGFPKKAQGHSDKPILFSKVSDMNLEGNEKYIYKTINTIDDNIATSIKAKIHPVGTVIFPKIGGAIATNKRRIIVQPTAIDNNCLGITPIDYSMTEWFYLLLSSIDFTNYQSGTSLPALNQGTLNLIVIALPPLEEQKRIVAKVDQLMALCDQLESFQQKKNESRIQLNNSALNKMLDAGSPEEFAEHWQLVCENFDLLYDDLDNLEKLKQAILQLAVQGKLVEQDENDEPAEVLLEKIRAEKEMLVKEGKIKKSKPMPPIDYDEIPYKLPKKWTWTRFPEIGDFGRGKSKHRPRNDPILYSNGTYPLIQTGDVARANGIIHTYSNLYNDHGLSQSKLWPKGTLCITIAANIADSAVLGFDACFPDSVVGFIPFFQIRCAKYFEYFIRTMKNNLNDFASSTAQKNINLGVLEKVLIPLPPLEEQKRIVVKVEQLMALCDHLEAKIRQAQSDSDVLMEVSVSHLLEA